MTMPKEQMKFRPEKETFSEWGAVFLAIVVTAVLVAVVGGMLVSKNLEENRKKESEAFRARQEKGSSIFPALLDLPQEPEQE